MTGERVVERPPIHIYIGLLWPKSTRLARAKRGFGNIDEIGPLLGRATLEASSQHGAQEVG
jgi:hypothetical protein